MDAIEKTAAGLRDLEPDEDEAGGTRDTETEEAQKPPKTKRSRGIRPKGGRREMKEYPLTEGELWGLGGLGLAATIFFSIGSFALSQGFSLWQSIAVNPAMNKETLGYLKGLTLAAWITCGFFYVLGVIFSIVSGLTILKIRRETIHPE